MVSNVKIAIATTPRANRSEGVKQWKDYVREHFSAEIAEGQIAKLVVAMPTRTQSDVGKELGSIIDGTPEEFWAEMEPGLIGAGDTYRGACFFAFGGRESASNIPVDYVLHIPIDVDFGNPHPDDVQYSLRKLLDPVNSASSEHELPALVIGDYIPMIWDDTHTTSKQSPFKVFIEEHVKEQLRHYFPNNIVDRLGINRPRTEFFLISKKLFEVVDGERRFSPYDPMPQVLIFADRKNFWIEKVDLGKFYETSPKFSSVSIREQVFRTTAQISTEWLRWEHSTSLKSHEVRLLSGMWMGIVLEGMSLAFEALERMLRDPHVV
jgi:hypothetical protein